MGRLIRAKFIVFIHFGTPCSSFSIARKDDWGHPPLQDRHHLWGLPDLAPRDLDKLKLGHEFIHLTVQWATLLTEFGLSWSIENPANSFLWDMPPMVALAALHLQSCSGSICDGLARDTRNPRQCSPTST